LSTESFHQHFVESNYNGKCIMQKQDETKSSGLWIGSGAGIPVVKHFTKLS
jgi:hypothetical protein